MSAETVLIAFISDDTLFNLSFIHPPVVDLNLNGFDSAYSYCFRDNDFGHQTFALFDSFYIAMISICTCGLYLFSHTPRYVVLQYANNVLVKCHIKCYLYSKTF